MRLLNPGSKLFTFFYMLRHPIKTGRRMNIHFKKSSIFNDKDDLHGCSLLPLELLRNTKKILKPSSILDVGCGTGKSLDWFLSNDIETVGLEGSPMAISHAFNSQKIRQTDLNKPFDLNRKFDIVWCFEVAEHIHPDYTAIFIRSLILHSDTILFSAAHPGQGGVGHFNEQPRSYWIDLFSDLGYLHDEEGRTSVISGWTWFPENIFLFRKISQ